MPRHSCVSDYRFFTSAGRPRRRSSNSLRADHQNATNTPTGAFRRKRLHGAAHCGIRRIAVASVHRKRRSSLPITGTGNTELQGPLPQRCVGFRGRYQVAGTLRPTTRTLPPTPNPNMPITHCSLISICLRCPHRAQMPSAFLTCRTHLTDTPIPDARSRPSAHASPSASSTTHTTQQQREQPPTSRATRGSARLRGRPLCRGCGGGSGRRRR